MKRLKYAAIAAGALFLVIVFLVVVLNPDPKATVNRPFTAQQNVKPPAAGVPPSAKSVSGIYRSIGEDLLQLRADGQFTLTDKRGADGGVFGLVDGRFDVKTTRCGDARGTYSVIVTGPQEAGRAALQFTVQDDGCLDRRTTLTAKPWVYANS